ncbi:MAG TPA: TauD/TfdA family dioxygenase [Acetobacteraceae bacterium]|jgi:alpha-ketoglutarate-dependent 2,4-dichlorophenoxyacetate dioxygenase
MAISFRPLHSHFAAEVQGFDMREPIDAATTRIFEDAIDRHAVLVFPAQQVDDAQQLAFTANFGPPDIGRKKAVQTADARVPPEMIDLSNLDENGYVIDPDHRRVLSLLGTRLWHTDSSYQRPAAKFSMLRAVAVPPWGGETEFADCRAAYDALPEVLRIEAGDRFAEHWVHHSRSTLGWEPTEAEIRGAMPPVRWPLVRVHAGSGRKTLYIGAHARRVIGLKLPAGRILLRDLQEHATQPAFVYRHAWRVGDLVLWDNRAVMHRGCRYDLSQVRDMRRTTVLDPVSVTERDCEPDAAAA